LEQLKNQLDKLAPQINSSNTTLEISIVISINEDSLDDYSQIISTYESKKIIFRRNFDNIGGNANITLGFVLYHSFKYIWILSDDDYIHPNCIKYLIPAISQNYDFIHIGDYSDIDYHKPPIKLSNNNIFDITKGAGLGMISTGIINFDFIRSSVHYAYDYMSSSFPHLAIYMGALKKKGHGTLGLVEHSKVFTGEELLTHGGADYSVSLYGFLYLADFLDMRNQKLFLKNWFLGCYEIFFRERKKNQIKFNKASGYLLMYYPSIFFRGYILFKFKYLMTFSKSLLLKIVKNV